MIGLTNVIIKDKEYEPDNNTIFLMRDKLYDDSKNHIPIYMVGSGTGTSTYNAGSGVFAGISANIPSRDGRNYIQFMNGGNCLYLGQANVIDQLGDWTVECWRYIISYVNNASILHQRQLYTGPGHGIIIGYANGDNHTLFYVSDDGSSHNIINGKSIGSMTNGAWHHMAVCKNGNNYLCFVDGVLTNTYVGAKTPSNNIARITYIGGFAGNSNSLERYTSSIDGALQDFRISNICRYTSNFTPPQML